MIINHFMHSIAQNDHKILMITNNTQQQSSSKQNHHRFDSKLFENPFNFQHNQISTVYIKYYIALSYMLMAYMYTYI